MNATFTDTNALPINQLTAAIDYGDGTTVSNGMITEVGGPGSTTYTVTDQHTFPEESGSTVPPFAFTVTLTVTETASPANMDTQTASGQVLDAALAPGDPVV